MAEFAKTTKETTPEAEINMSTANSTTPSTVENKTSTSTSSNEVTFGLKLDTTLPSPDLSTANSTSSGMGITSPDISESDIPSNINVASVDELEANQTEMVTPRTTEPTGSLSYTPTITSDEKILAQIADKTGQVEDLKKKRDVALAEENLNKQKEDLSQAFSELGDMSDFIAQVEEEAELNKRREELTEITNKIRRKELDFRRQIEGIQDLPGLTRAQKNARITDVDRRNSREIADLEIIAMARQGRYNDAAAIVDRKVEIEMQARANQLEGLKFLYQENKERFSTQEQREFERTLTKEERAYQEEFSKRKELESLKLQMTINATEAGAGINELQAIQEATDTKSLFGVKNASRYMKTKAQILDERLKEAQIASVWNSMAGSNEGTVTINGNTYTKEDLISAQNKNEVLTQVLSQVKKLKTMSGKEGAIGFSLQRVPFSEDNYVAGTNAKSYAEEVNRLVSLLSFENLDKLKGAMSDNDLKFLKSIGTSLNLRGNEGAFDSELLRIENEAKTGYNSTAPILGLPAWGSLSPDEEADRLSDEIDRALQSGSSVYQNALGD